MTLPTTAVAAPRPGAALPAPTPAEVVLLQSLRAEPAVSVLLTTTPGERMTRDDTARLDRLVGEAAARLELECAPGPRRKLVGVLRELAADAAGRRTRSAVALFAADGTCSSWSLPVPVVDRVVVDPTFATRDLVRALHRTPRHVVLVLTDREARLFDGVADLLLPAVGSAFPLVTGRRRGTGRPARLGRAPRAPRGTTGDDDAFLRTVDAALGAHLTLHPAPLVVVGATRTVSAFTRISRNTGRLAGVLTGSHARTPLPTLVTLVRPVLDAYLRSREAEALALLDRRTGQGRAVTGMAAVWLAARTERPEMLLVDPEFFYPARLSADGDLLTPATDVHHPDVVDDAVDEVIEIVLQRGGWVALGGAEALADRGRIALTLARP